MRLHISRIVLGKALTKVVTLAVFVDFRKAFDSVNHQLLLKKLPGYGIKNYELRWFENYLTSRCLSVVLWQRTVCTSADKIWRPTRVHTWSDFVFDLPQWFALLFTSVKDPTLCGRCCPFLRWLQNRKYKYCFAWKPKTGTVLDLS